MSPLVWDLAHIGQQEELWLLRGGDINRPGMLPPAVEGLYDAFEYSRASRVELPLLSPERAHSYCRTVRSAVLDVLDTLPDSAGQDGEFVFGMVVSHENQHDETMLQALNLRVGAPLLPDTVTLPVGRPGLAGTSVLVPAGPFVLGVDAASEPYSLDNERPAHVVDLPAFRIGRVPVTNGEWRQFIDDGGYDESRWWSDRGWQHRQAAGLSAPQFWIADGRTRFGHVEDVPPDEPVQHVTYFEAEAYAAWAGARLPTEAEWEKGCAWDPATGTRRRYPWGAEAPSESRANLGGTALRPAPVGAYPGGASAYGAEQMLGDVWEWTSSPLRPWPGFVPMIYERYSQPFFDGDYRVLRGGSWAVESAILRPSFRNWDHPVPPADFLRRPVGLGRLMCRHLGWLGREVTISSLVLDPPHSLRVQSYAPRRQKHGLMNADGWGVGLFDSSLQGEVPRRWRSPAPLWGDVSFDSIAPALRSHCVVAAVRSATVGMAIEASATAPFTDGQWLLSHNGVVDRTVLPADLSAESVCDSAILAAAIFARGLDALGETVCQVGAADPDARLNVLAANGSRLLATVWGDTLSILRRDDGVVLASEPYDDEYDWEDVPDRHLVEVTADGVVLTPLDPPKGH